ncbi:MobA/MobL family protein [Litorivita pollutaquae]|uniref:MobA/MobL family protein n=1 Tax=Litorivita pollutaquae TaxID=2200892 RepID=UPI0013A67893|nr:MobA/MobL family protein [Litorivita pollutaquae]
MTTATNPTASKAVHYKTQPIARRKDQSAVYYAAYITGETLHDVRRDKTFWRKDDQGDVLHWEIVGPDGEQNWTLSELWNGAEHAAKKINERPGRQTVIALPHELCEGGHEAARRVARGHCLWLRDQYGIASTWALHAPSPKAHGESAKNWHIHIVETDRRMTASGDGRPVFGAKVRELTDGKQGKVEIERRRKDWEKRVNAELHRVGAATRVNLGRKPQGDGPDYIPGVHRGPKVNAMLRKHQAATRVAMIAGRALPPPPKRVASYLAYAAARKSANAAHRAMWQATGKAVSQIVTASVQFGEPTAPPNTVKNRAEPGQSKDTATSNAPPSDVTQDEEKARKRDAKDWERFWEQEARKALSRRQRQR